MATGFDFAESSKHDTTGGLGAVEAEHALAKSQNAAAWSSFLTAAKRLRVGGTVKIAGRSVSIRSVDPITGGRFHIKGFHELGAVDGTFAPEELKTA